MPVHGGLEFSATMYGNNNSTKYWTPQLHGLLSRLCALKDWLSPQNFFFDIPTIPILAISSHQ